MLPVPARDSTIAPPTVQAEDDPTLVRLWLHGKAPHSQRAYRREIQQFLTAVAKPLRLITLLDLQTYAESLTTAPASRHRALGAVKSLLGFAHRLGYLPFDVGAALTLRRPEPTLAARILDRQAVTRLLALEAQPRNRALLQLLYDAGLRVSELCRLTGRDLQAREDGCAQISVLGKGDKRRVVLIAPRTYTLLQELRGEAGDSDPLFRSQRGQALDPSQVWRIVRQAAQRAGITLPVSPHWLRHACASHALDGGAPVHLVQQQLGHSSLEVTTRYAHARPSDGLFRYLGQ
jgi:integrase/recombinase XerD